MFFRHSHTLTLPLSLSLSTGFTTTQFFWRLFNSKRHFLVRFSSAEIFTLVSTLRSDSRYRSANEQESFFVHIFAAPLCVPSLFGVLMIIHTQKTFVPFLFFLLLFLLLLFLFFFSFSSRISPLNTISFHSLCNLYEKRTGFINVQSKVRYKQLRL